MPSIKPKIQGYVEPELFSAFEQWRIEQGKGISEALNDLLKEFFGFDKILPSAPGGLKQEDLEDLIEKKLANLIIRLETNEQKIQHLENERLQKLVEGALVAYSMPLILRIEAVEQIIKPIEGLAEISHPLPESVGDSLQSPFPLERLKQSDLERRLKISKGILTKRRDRADFKEWSQSRDPQGIAWAWDAITKKYLAVEQ